MKVLRINGYSDSGKTTVAENLIKELRVRGYTVGSVKEICCKSFSMDTEGTDTFRHAKAGSQIVTARGLFETDMLINERLSISDILSFYSHDFCILEGVEDINAPKIVTARTKADADEKIDDLTIALSGVIANDLKEYKGLPVINCVTGISTLTDIVVSKVPEKMPDFDSNCCGKCGADCRSMLAMILSGEKTRRDCIADNTGLNLRIGGKPVPMVPFVQNILRNAVLGVVKELDGYTDGADVEITSGKTKW